MIIKSIIEIIMCLCCIWAVFNEWRFIELEDKIKRKWIEKRQIKNGTGTTAGTNDKKIVRFNKNEKDIF